MKLISTILIAIPVCAEYARAQVILDSQQFNDLASATAAGWSGSNNTSFGNNFGFSATNFASGGTASAGEAGGVFARATSASYYADTTLNGVFSRTTSFQASGQFNVTSISTNPAFNGGFEIGHFSTSDVSTVSANIGEESSTSIRFRALIIFSDGTTLTGNDLILTNLPNSPRNWSYTWNPNGGASGLGELSLTIDGSGGGTSILDLTSAQNGKTFDINSFGLLDRSFNDSNASTITSYIDSVQYSAYAVPEPSCLLLCILLITFIKLSVKMIAATSFGFRPN